MVRGKGKGKGTAAGPGQMVLGVAPYPPPLPPLAFSGAQRVVGASEGEVTPNAARRSRVVLGVALPPSDGARAWVGDAPVVSGARRVVVGGKGKGKGTMVRPGQVVLGVAPYPPPPPPPGVFGALESCGRRQEQGQGHHG